MIYGCAFMQDLPYFADEAFLHRLFVCETLFTLAIDFSAPITPEIETCFSHAKTVVCIEFEDFEDFELQGPVQCFNLALFAATGSLVSVKIMRNKSTQISLGYGFLDFSSHEAANTVLATFNGKAMPGTNNVFRSANNLL